MAIAAAVERALAAVYARQPALQVAAAVTGGGGASAQLLFRPGSSSTMLQFSVPYARASLLEFLGGKETEAEVKFCSAETAQRMAAAAWRKAAALARKDGADAGEAVARFQLAVGVACTAALATNYAKKGPHEAFVSVCRATPSDANVVAPRCDTYHLTLDKALGRSRLQEDDIVSGWLVYALARVAAVDAGSCDDLFAELTGELSGQDSFRVVSTQASSPSDVRDPLDSICGDGASSQLSSVCFLPDHDSASGKKSVLITQDFEFRGIVLPGSFNPLHIGHIDLALAAQRKWKAEKGRELPIGFEMAVANADKGSIASSTVMERVKQFGPDSSLKLGEYPVLVTNATLFGQKAELLRNCVFVIGADTAVRIVDKKYYEDDEHRMVLALQRIADHGCSFVVAGRFDDKVSNSFISAESVLESHIPRVFRKLFVPLSESDYRNDISSTKLRQQAAAAAKAQQ